jgi:hypothetical protein
MNSTNPICDPFPKVVKESKAALPVVVNFRKNFGKIRLTLVEFTEKLHVIATVATIALTTLCDLT